MGWYTPPLILVFGTLLPTGPLLSACPPANLGHKPGLLTTRDLSYLTSPLYDVVSCHL